jgi:hypothetical protein
MIAVTVQKIRVGFNRELHVREQVERVDAKRLKLAFQVFSTQKPSAASLAFSRGSHSGFQPSRGVSISNGLARYSSKPGNCAYSKIVLRRPRATIAAPEEKANWSPDPDHISWPPVPVMVDMLASIRAGPPGLFPLLRGFRFRLCVVPVLGASEGVLERVQQGSSGIGLCQDLDHAEGREFGRIIRGGEPTRADDAH